MMHESQLISRSVTCLLLDLQAIDDGRELAEDLVRLLVVLHLGSDELGEVAERLRGVEDLGEMLASADSLGL